MVTDEMIRRAAIQSSMAWTEALEQDYKQDVQYEPSAKFKKRIRKLSRKVNQPYLYGTLQRVASIVLAILMTGSAWLTFDAQARDVFFGWVKEVYEEFFVYRLEGDMLLEGDSSTYTLGWIPDGYTEAHSIRIDGTTTVLWINENGQFLEFSYTSPGYEIDWFLDGTNVEQHEIEIGVVLGEFFLSTDSQTASALVWIQEDNTAFYLSGFFDEAELLELANSIVEK